MMKKSIVRTSAWLLSLVLSFTLLSACTGGNGDGSPSDSTSSAAVTDDGGDDGPDTSEQVELKMYLLGDRSSDFDEVYSAINEILIEEVNASVSVEFLAWGEHETKYSLLFSGQEDFDLIFTASSWGHYEQTAALGGFEPLTEDLLQTYAPDIWDVVPQMAWDQAMVESKIYMVPNYQNEFGQDTLAVRGDLMAEFGFDEISNWDELKAFYLSSAENGIYAAQGGPWYQYFQSKGMGLLSGTPKASEMILYNTQNPEDAEIYYILDWEGFADYAKQAKELADAGAWSQDVLNSNDDRQTGLLTGVTSTMAWNMGTTLIYGRQANAENPDWNVTLVDPNADMPKQVNKYTNNGVGINVNSQNKGRSLMVLNEFYTNPAVQDLAMLGIEGKHWEAVGDDQYKLLDQSGYGANSNCNWGWTNMEIRRTEFVENRTAIDDRFDELQADWNNNLKADHIYDGFSFDNASVTTQVAAVEATVDAYYNPLVNGLVSDVDATLAEFERAMEAAGIRDILDEIERQTAEFWAEKEG